MTEEKRNIIHQLMEKYDIQTTLKELLGGTIKKVMEEEMNSHLGYENSERSGNDNNCSSYKHKRMNSSYGSMKIEVPQDKKFTFEPQVV